MDILTCHPPRNALKTGHQSGRHRTGLGALDGERDPAIDIGFERLTDGRAVYRLMRDIKTKAQAGRKKRK